MADTQEMQGLTEGLQTVSDKIRALNRAGFSRSEIARFLGKRYQHVRNVLVADEDLGRTRDGGSVVPAGRAHAPTELNDEAPSTRTRLESDGRVLLPESVRQRLGVKEGDALFVRVEGGEVHLLTPRAAMARAQKILREFIPDDVCLSEELIRERRREAEREANRD